MYNYLLYLDGIADDGIRFIPTGLLGRVRVHEHIFDIFPEDFRNEDLHAKTLPRAFEFTQYLRGIAGAVVIFHERSGWASVLELVMGVQPPDCRDSYRFIYI